MNAVGRQSFVRRLGRTAATVLLLPFDLLRLTRLFVALTVRYVVQIYLNLLSGLPRQRPPTMEFYPCRRASATGNWDGQERFVVRRAATLRMLGIFCGRRDVCLRGSGADESELAHRMRLSRAECARMALCLALSWSLLIGVPLAAGSAAWAATRGRDRAQAYRLAADRLLENDEWSKARIQYLNAIQQRPSDPAAHWGLARCNLKLERAAEARNSLERTLELDADHAAASAALIDLLLAQGNAGAALEHAERAAQASPDAVETQLRLGECLRQLGRQRAARQQAEAVLNRQPENGRALVLAALASAESGDRKAALEYLERATAVLPEDHQDRFSAAKVYVLCGQPEAAKTQLEKLLARDPANVPALQELAEMQLASGDLAGAIAQYQTLDRLPTSTPAIGIRLAELLLVAQRLDEAFQKGLDLERACPNSAAGPLVLGSVYYLRDLWGAGAEQCRLALRRAPDSIAGKILLCRILMRQEQWDEVLSWLSGLPKSARDTLDVRLMLAECHVAREDRQAAQALLSQICADWPDVEAPHLLLARLQLAVDDGEKAIASYRRALEINPEHPLALNNLAALLAAREAGAAQNVEEAYRLASKAWSLRPGNPEIAETLGWIQVLRGECDRGHAMLRYAVRQQPRNPVVHYHLAYALAGLNRLEDARSQLELAEKLQPNLAAGKEFQALRAKLSRPKDTAAAGT